jgi:ATP-dependent DNA helicase PIF1
MYDHSLDLESITGQRILLPRIDLTPSDSTLPFSFTRRKFPIRIAFAMTINNTQGQTLDKVGLYLTHPVFSHGQFNVAMSRLDFLKSLKYK